MRAGTTPAVRICVPVYNSAATLPETLESILSQTYTNLTVAIVDNASTDATLSLADSVAAKDHRVTVFRNTKNVGLEGNFTRCLQLAEGKYTAIYHSDDIYSPTIVEEQVSFLESQKSAGVVFTMAEAITWNGKSGRIYQLPPPLKKHKDGLCNFAEIFRAMLRYDNFLFCPSAMARTEVYRDHVKKWDLGGYRSASDVEVWLRIASSYAIGIIDKPLLRYRVSQASFTYRSVRLRTTPHDVLRVFEDYMAGPASSLIGSVERSDYNIRVIRDNVERGFNLLMSGRRGEAIPLLKTVFNPLLFFNSLCSFSRMKVVSGGVFLFFLSLFPLGSQIKELLARARFGANYDGRLDGLK